jgi:hypothetical protein
MDEGGRLVESDQSRPAGRRHEDDRRNEAAQSTARVVVAGQGRSVAIELTAEGASAVMEDTHNKNAARRLQ